MTNIYIVDYYSAHKTNGLTTYVRELGSSLPEGYRINYLWLSAVDDYKQPARKTGPSGEDHIFIPGDITPAKPEYNLLVCQFLRQELKDRELIFHFNWINHCFFSWFLKKHLRCKTLLTKHCITWREMIGGKQHADFLRLDAMLQATEPPVWQSPLLTGESIQYHSLDHIICVSEFARRDLERMMHYPAEKIAVVYNGLRPVAPPVQEYRQDRGRLRAYYGFGQEEQIILFAGKLDARKGAYDLVKAFLEMVEAEGSSTWLRLIFAGVGDFGELLKQAPRHWTRITMTGFLDREKLSDMYRLADVGVVPSHIEQCSYAAIEMMHHQLPIIIADVDGLREIVPDDCGLKVPRFQHPENAGIDIAALKEKLYFFLNDTTTARQYADRAHRHAIQHFNSEIMTTHTIKVYEKTGRRTAPAPIAESGDNPLISIVLPCYNAGEFLQDCLNSIFSQSYPHFELIIVNDGSTDETKEIILRNEDERIRLVENPENQGIVKSLNKGIKLAKGAFIARIDADDLMHEHRLRKQLSFLLSPENQDVGIVGSNHYVIDKIGMPVSRSQYPLTDADIRACMIFRNPISHPSVLIRSECLKKNRYRVKYRHNEDFNLWTRISKQYRLANIPECLTYYRIHDANVSRNHFKELQEHTIELLSDQLDEYGIEYSTEDLSLHAAICFGYGRAYFKDDARKAALKRWVDKVLTLYQVSAADQPADGQLNAIQNYILEHYCQVYP
ncbi:glycosyltransferase [Chitinophaga rhizosphaerae]|uniref:glycosyltransferase n=1 Tax=Chitinophaga rhizosphaerae TaxID=1864947 RepID=UPI000F805676|nr:glycosyltransferase [Chitinophaga rhizosphaerae]